MFDSKLIAKTSLVIFFNSLDTSVNNISNIMNDMRFLFYNIKNRYISLRYDIFSTENSFSTNFDTHLESLLVISKQLNTCKYGKFEKLLELDIEKKHFDKISKLKIGFDFLKNSISVLCCIDNCNNSSYKYNLNSFDDYMNEVKRLITLENFLFKLE